jgi:acyl-homoserine lactone acylase PvdQ
MEFYRARRTRSLNPDRGFIVTSNNKTISKFPVEMNGTYAPRYRYERIEEMIEGKIKWISSTSKGCRLMAEHFS